MTEPYLDTHRSVIISSPAGSGKTEKLARRFISLLMDGSPLERIVCITFTEKAAAEMKERILRIMREEHPAELAGLLPRVPLMRISTIHAFCRKLITRFSFELGIDPALDIMDEMQAAQLWSDAIYERLRMERDRGTALSGLISERGLKGWASVVRVLNEMHRKRHFIEMLIESGGPMPKDETMALFLEAYASCLSAYAVKKARLHLLDFNDLELMAYRALLHNPEWSNILFSFDEHTDHILVDEFQDTSSLQWHIIEKLTEEWRAGLGAKRESGRTPTIFLVGDVKQSIYLFRGGNPSVFKRAGELFTKWLGDEYVYYEARENYRSLPAIVEFTNALFSRLMPQDQTEQWQTRYAPFNATRTGAGNVELVMIEGEGNRHAIRTHEALLLARAIKSKVIAKSPVIENEAERAVTYRDMAILLRGRTHLGIFEEALRENGIPFVVLKGIGFFDEPETAVLREFVSFIADPADDYSLFCVLRSPLFGLDSKVMQGLLIGGCGEDAGMLERMRASRLKHVIRATAVIDSLLKDSASVPIGQLIESLMIRTRGWELFAEPERRANIKKFIILVESYEARGLTALELRETLIRLKGAHEIPRANINSEDMDAVRIMTIHASKGLQFPYVFLPSMDEGAEGRNGPFAIDDEYGPIQMEVAEDSEARKKLGLFKLLRAKAGEEDKRLFYVAVTRAMDSLTMLGTVTTDKKGDPKYSGRMDQIHQAFDLGKADGYPFTLLRETDIPAVEPEEQTKHTRRKSLRNVPVHVESIPYIPGRVWRDVTDDTMEVRERHGEHGIVVGRVMHTIFEELSKGHITKDLIRERASRLLADEPFEIGNVHEQIIADIGRMDSMGLLDEIVMPRPDAHAELSFVLEREGITYNGRIDRVIIKDSLAHVYDYKTYPVTEMELVSIKDQYRHQMSVYKEAAGKLFDLPARGYLVLTKNGTLVEM